MRTNRLCRVADLFGTASGNESGNRKSRKTPLTVRVQDGKTVLAVGEQQIWDGAVLVSLREALVSLVDRENCQSIALDMSHVKHLWSGFFGELCDWREKGIEIRLISPLISVREMLWFRVFFEALSDDCYVLLSEPKQSVLRGMFPEWIPGGKTLSEAQRPNLNGSRLEEDRLDHPQRSRQAGRETSPSRNWHATSPVEPPFNLARIVDSLRNLGGRVEFDERGEVVCVAFSASKIVNADLALLSGLKKLEWLKLDHTKIFDAGMKHVSQLTSLRVLHLIRTRISDAGLESLRSLTHLEDLNLSKTQVTDAGVKHLAAHPHLFHLALYETSITDAGLIHLEALTGLQQLWIGKTAVTDAGELRLKRALSNCSVIR